MLNTIVVTLDGTAFAEHALPIAVSIAQKANARLQLVHALDLLGRPDYADGVPALEWWGGGARDRAHAYVLNLTNRISDSSRLRVTGVVLDPPIVQNLIDFAHKADLIVMATHGRGPLRRIWLGSTGDEIARNAPCPVLFLRLKHERKPLPDVTPFRHILVPLDGSRMAEAILPIATELAYVNNARITLIHAVQPPIPQIGSAPMLAGMEPVFAAELLPEPDCPVEPMERIADRLLSRGVRADVEMIRGEFPTAKAILRYARDHYVDLIAMTTHGRGGFERLILGSISHSLIRHAPCPVLIMRPDPEFQAMDPTDAAAEFQRQGG